MTYQNIIVKIENRTAILTINREKNLNALNRETIQEIDDAFKSFLEHEDVRGVIITGSGHKAFVAGADIKEFMSYSTEEGVELARWGHGVMSRIYHFPKPVIAAVNGFALGGGLELALACHLRVASDNAKLGLPEVSLGLIPGYGGTQRLALLVGRGKALEMILTGDMIDAYDALQWGLVNHVTSQDDLYEVALNILGKIYGKSANAVSKAIEAVNAGYDKDKNGYDVEIESFGDCFHTPDFKEGVDAFLSKRKPNF